jgi:multidrug efflux system membrane fusion protein
MTDRHSNPLVAPLAALMFSVLLAACGREAAEAPGPRPVVVEAPAYLASALGEHFPGAVHARVEADLSFRVPGKIAARKIETGARVERGTVLAVLDPQDARLNLDAAQATVAAAEANLWLAQEEERRHRDLREKGYVGQSAVDARINAAKLAAARLDQARSQLDLARNQSQYTELKAERAGVVIAVLAEAGNVVSAGQPVVRVAEDGEREVRIVIPEGRLDVLRKAEKIVVALWSQPDRHYEGRVREINPQADPRTRTHDARITIVDADEGVQLGGSATVATAALGDGQTFRLPATALGTSGQERPAVWRVERDDAGRDVARPVNVEVLQFLHDAVVVTGPLSPEDRLISAGVHLLVPDMPVAPIERTAKAAL